MSAICISGRNEYSKGAIQNDFAAGIKELDQENLAEEDEEAFNPEEEIRDYDEVAQSLPVFCVSSRAYQKMSGRLKKDEKVPGFTTPEETGVGRSINALCIMLIPTDAPASSTLQEAYRGRSNPGLPNVSPYLLPATYYIPTLGIERRYWSKDE